jgi:hypothetical protein
MGSKLETAACDLYCDIFTSIVIDHCLGEGEDKRAFTISILNFASNIYDTKY